MDKPSAYLLGSPLNHRAYCQCGWTGKRRWLRGSAVLDVLDHCGESGHTPASIPPITHGRASKARQQK
jgi:hypothetical protein